jgi:hypothetical protein
MRLAISKTHAHTDAIGSSGARKARQVWTGSARTMTPPDTSGNATLDRHHAAAP